MTDVSDWLGNSVTFSHDADGNVTAQANDPSTVSPGGTSLTAFSYDPGDLPSEIATTFAAAPSPGPIVPESTTTAPLATPAATGSSTAPVTATSSGTSSRSTATVAPSVGALLARGAKALGLTAATLPKGLAPSPGSSSSTVTSTTTCTPTTETLVHALGVLGGERNADGQVLDSVAALSDLCGNGYSGTESFTYDQAGQLTSQAGLTGFAYDANGDPTEITSSTPSPVTADQKFAPSGAVLSQTPAGSAGGTSYTYDSLGDRIQATSASGTVSYGYNQLGQLTTMDSASGTTSYGYSSQGLERFAQAPGQSAPTQLTWGANGSIPFLMSDTTACFVYGPGTTPVEQVDVTPAPPTSNPTFLNYQGTEAASTYVITDTAGSETNITSYDVLGNLTEAGTSGSVFGFAGQYQNATTNPTGFTNMRARWYDSGTDTFTTVDPMLSETGQPYLYAGNDPVNGSDPSGMTSNYYGRQGWETPFIDTGIFSFTIDIPAASGGLMEAVVSNDSPNPFVVLTETVCSSRLGGPSGCQSGAEIDYGSNGFDIGATGDSSGGDVFSYTVTLSAVDWSQFIPENEYVPEVPGGNKEVPTYPYPSPEPLSGEEPYPGEDNPEDAAWQSGCPAYAEFVGYQAPVPIGKDIPDWGLNLRWVGWFSTYKSPSLYPGYPAGPLGANNPVTAT